MTRRPLYAYYYPAHHPSASGWYEWDLVRAARPWFDGHAKPDVPRWGYYDDTRPETFVRQARAAWDGGLDGFVIDFYWRPDGATLYEEVLQRAILPSFAAGAVPDGLRFALLWCPVWPRPVLPIGMDQPPTAEGTDRLFPFGADDLLALVEHARPYLAHPRVARVDGRPLLGIFHAWRLATELGAGLGDAIVALRRRAAALGVGDLFLVGCINQSAEAALLAASGLDALSSYVWLPEWNGPPRQDYRALVAARRRDWDALRARSPIAWLPGVATGWDATPRGTRDWDGARRGFPFTPVVEGATPAAIADAVAGAVRWLDEAGAPTDRPVLVASWNEWSESHRLEPCERWGDAALRAIAAAHPRR